MNHTAQHQEHAAETGVQTTYAPARTDYLQQLLGAGLKLPTDMIRYACRQWPAVAAIPAETPNYGLELGSPLGEGVSLGPYLPTAEEGLNPLTGTALNTNGRSPWDMTAPGERGQWQNLRHASQEEINLSRLRGKPACTYPGDPNNGLHNNLISLGPHTGSGTLLLMTLLQQLQYTPANTLRLPLMGSRQGWSNPRAGSVTAPALTIQNTLYTAFVVWLTHAWTLSAGPDFSLPSGLLYWDDTLHEDPAEDAWLQMLCQAGSLAEWPADVRALRGELSEQSVRTGRRAQGGITVRMWSPTSREPHYLQRRIRLCVQGTSLVRVGIVQMESRVPQARRRKTVTAPSPDIRYGQWSSPCL